MNTLFHRYLTVTLLFFLFYSCKKNETDPANGLEGTWIIKSSTGSALFGTKTYDTKDKTAPITIDDFSELVFNQDGTVEADGERFNYTLENTQLTIKSKNIRVVFKAVISSGELTLALDETGAKEMITPANALLPASQRLTKYNRTTVYRSLDKILTTNGTPECLMTQYKYTFPGSNGTTGETIRTYFYNKEHKMSGYEIRTGSTLTRSDFEENKANLGSETDPYVIEKKNGKVSTKFYTNEDGRINVLVSFSSSDENTPAYVEKNFYDAQGYRSKTETSYYQTGDKEIKEYEYSSGNLARVYYQKVKQNGSVATHRYLNYSYSYSTVTYKPSIISMVNTGPADANYLSESKIYNADGSLLSSSKNFHTFDSKGNLLELKTETVAGYIYTYSYTYDCAK